VITCPRCGEQNPAHARFCLHCGAPLSAPAGQERRLVTVVFCDLVGFTRRSDRADPEDVHATLRAFHAPIKRVVEHYDGTVDKFIGDAVMAVFGAPIAHEDDPLRAVLAARAIQEAIEDQRTDREGEPLAVRIGIDTGEAVVAYGVGPQIGESIAGDVVHTAALLQSVAPPGGTVVGEATHRATRHVVRYEQLRSVQGPGGRGSIEAWRPIEAQARTGQEPSGRDTPFVGRSDESATLRQLFRRVRTAARAPGQVDGALQLVTVVGEPGIGKSRLIGAFADHVEELSDLVRWRQGRCLPYGEGVSFWALSEAVKAEAGIMDDDDPAEARAALDAAIDAAVPDEQERGWLRPRLAALLGLGEGDDDAPREERFRAWARYLEALAQRGPFVLVIEDLHWADDAMLEFIEYLAQQDRDSPMFILCATRPELLDRRPDWGASVTGCTTILLPPLSEGETASLIAALLERAVLPAETQASLIERSGGNPLYAEEFVQMLTDRGLLAADGSLTETAHGAIPVPESLQAVIGARLDALPLDLRSLMHDAAVVGKVFWSGAVARISGREEDEVRRLLEHAVRRQLIRPARTSSLRGQAEYVFWHLLVRDAAYGQIPRASRATKHLACARWLTDVVGERAPDFAEEIAFHYGEVLDPRGVPLPADVDDVASIRGEAATAFMLAGERALRLDARRADEALHRALSLMDAHHPDLGRASLDAARAAGLLGHVEEAEQLYLSAVVATRTSGDRRALGEAIGLLSRHHSKWGDPERGRHELAEAIEILEAEGHSPELARTYNRRANEALLFDEHDSCITFAENALALARSLDMPGEIVRALQARGAARCELGDDAGLDDMREAIRLGLELGLLEETIVSVGNLAYQLWFREGPAIAYETWRSMEELASARGYASHVQMARMGQLETLFDLGDWDQVLEIAQEMGTWDLPQERRSVIGVYAQMFEAWIHLRRGQLTGLTAAAETIAEGARRVAYTEYVTPALVLLAEARRAEGDLQGAQDALDEFATLTAEVPNYRVFMLPVAVRAFLAMGKLEKALALQPFQADVRTERHALSFLTAKAAIAEARGELDVAARMFAEAATRWERYGFALEAGLTLLDLAQCQQALGRHEEAEATAAHGRDVLAPMGIPTASSPSNELPRSG
jgi:class 3 adenylate cyclase/tetratricopeptide (TPR) repeat protein